MRSGGPCGVHLSGWGFYVDESGHLNRKRHELIQTFRVLGEFGHP
jgi:hypothetical protein